MNELKRARAKADETGAELDKVVAAAWRLTVAPKCAECERMRAEIAVLEAALDSSERKRNVNQETTYDHT